MERLTILEIFGFCLAPSVELLALCLGIASNAIEMEGDSFLGGDYFLRWGGGGSVGVLARGNGQSGAGVRILLAEGAELVGDVLEGIGLVASLGSGGIGGGLVARVGAVGAVVGGEMGGERGSADGGLGLVCNGGEEAGDGHGGVEKRQ
jgi:hypothetical protein